MELTCGELAEILLDIDIFVNIRQNSNQARYYFELNEKNSCVARP